MGDDNAAAIIDRQMKSESNMPSIYKERLLSEVGEKREIEERK